LFRTLANYRRIPPTSHFFTQQELLDMLDKTEFEVANKEIIRDESNPYSLSANYIRAVSKK